MVEKKSTFNIREPNVTALDSLFRIHERLNTNYVLITNIPLSIHVVHVIM